MLFDDFFLVDGNFLSALADAYVIFDTLASGERASAVACAAMAAGVRWTLGIRLGFEAGVAFCFVLYASGLAGLYDLVVYPIFCLRVFICADLVWGFY